MNFLREISLCTTGILKFDDVTFRGHGSFEKKNFCCKIELFVVRSKIFQMLQIYLEKIWNILKSILWQILAQFNRFLQLRGLKVPKNFPKIQKCFGNLMFDLFKIHQKIILQGSIYFICNLLFIFSRKSEVFTLMILVLHPKAYWCRRLWTGTKNAFFWLFFGAKIWTLSWMYIKLRQPLNFF